MGGQLIPRGRFGTKNATALKSVVFCYHRSFSLPLCDPSNNVSRHESLVYRVILEGAP